MAMTDLVLQGVGIPPYSARGLRQTLTPIAEAAQLRRTVNGVLVARQISKFQKYSSFITGADQQPPQGDYLMPGTALTVDCIATLACPIGQTPERTVAGSWVDGDFLIFRPRLNMRVRSFSIERDEWQAGVSWSLELEEI